MQVLLLGNVSGLGRKGDVKQVKEGYYKNFLLPRKLAVAATSGNIKDAEEKRKNEIVQKERLLEEANEIAKKINGAKIVIKAKAKGDKLYGSITEKEVIDALKEKTNVQLDREHLKMTDHLKVVGQYEVPVSIGGKAEAKIVVEIKGE